MRRTSRTSRSPFPLRRTPAAPRQQPPPSGVWGLHPGAPNAATGQREEHRSAFLCGVAPRSSRPAGELQQPCRALQQPCRELSRTADGSSPGSAVLPRSLWDLPAFQVKPPEPPGALSPFPWPRAAQLGYSGGCCAAGLRWEQRVSPRVLRSLSQLLRAAVHGTERSSALCCAALCCAALLCAHSCRHSCSSSALFAGAEEQRNIALWGVSSAPPLPRCCIPCSASAAELVGSLFLHCSALFGAPWWELRTLCCPHRR